MNRPIRIGTRDSELALWQANTVKDKLQELGLEALLVPVKSEGDLRTEKPLYQLGITGIFTRALDIALLKEEIDLAVHSMKDVPTLLPEGITQAAVLERGNPFDVLVHKGLDFLNAEGIVATGSLRRKAQWLHRYPLHEITDLRGNVHTRLRKLSENNWNAAIFAGAGLERLNITDASHTVLQWMVPAPAQGAVVVAAREADSELRQAVSALNHRTTEICTKVERDFLRQLEGGCTAPIGALTQIEVDTITLKGLLSSLDGQRQLQIEKQTPLDRVDDFGSKCALELLEDGGLEIMSGIKSDLNR